MPRGYYGSGGGGWILFLFVVLFIVFAGCTPGYLFTSPEDARNVVLRAGFKNPVLTGSHRIFAELFGCGKSDVAIYKFKATNPAGTRISLKVCVGWPFKGSTIRY